jgi:hypothetical protein
MQGRWFSARPRGGTMEFAGVVGIFAVFFFGLVLSIQGVIGKETASEGRAFATPRGPEHPGMAHPRELHRGRLNPHRGWADGGRHSPWADSALAGC